jgi:L-alanine-DL-glutamate epimerase-like enolase superfamily enzyme
VGKVCKQPLHKLWGSFRSEMPLYLTTVWPVDHHQDEVTPAQQAADLLELKERGGYNYFKFRIQRSDWRKDVEAVRLCKEALGPDSKIMLDRTGDDAGDWSHETALEVAHALKKVGAEWLEEPFKREYTIDGASEETVKRHAHLTAESPLTITGAEHQPIAVYHDYLAGKSFDIVQVCTHYKCSSRGVLLERLDQLLNTWTYGLFMCPLSVMIVHIFLSCSPTYRTSSQTFVRLVSDCASSAGILCLHCC